MQLLIKTLSLWGTLPIGLVFPSGIIIIIIIFNIGLEFVRYFFTSSGFCFALSFILEESKSQMCGNSC